MSHQSLCVFEKPEARLPDLSLAQRCFEFAMAEDQLFEKLHEILTGTSLEGCGKGDFVWRIDECCCDYYDESVEVCLVRNAPPITREEADKILDLGFGCIYESQIDRGVHWTRDSHWCLSSPRKPNGEHSQLLRARAKINDLQKQIKTT